MEELPQTTPESPASADSPALPMEKLMETFNLQPRSLPKISKTVASAKRDLKSINFKKMLKPILRQSDINMSRLSKRMGVNSTFLSQRLKSADLRASVLLAMSATVGINLFEPYIKMLPADLPPTETEQKLQQQILDLQAKYNDLERERDLYKSILLKK